MPPRALMFSSRGMFLPHTVGWLFCPPTPCSSRSWFNPPFSDVFLTALPKTETPKSLANLIFLGMEELLVPLPKRKALDGQQV